MRLSFLRFSRALKWHPRHILEIMASVRLISKRPFFARFADARCDPFLSRCARRVEASFISELCFVSAIIKSSFPD